MNQRERFHAILAGRETDRRPYWYGGPRTSTFAAWRKQGLTEDLLARWGSFVGEEGFSGIGKVDFGPLPWFEEKVLEERGNLRIWRDHWGVTRVDARNQPTPGFATRAYLDFPVKTHDDFRRMSERFDPTTAERLTPVPGENARHTNNPDGYRVWQGQTCWRDRIGVCNNGDVPVSVGIPGLLWTARDWAGFEGLCAMCADDPGLVSEMMGFWTDFIIALLDEPLRAIRVDMVVMNEDMAYKTAAMLSPAMMRRFMLPNYRRLYAFFKEHGVACVAMDTDGHNSQVLDVFYPEAIDGITPMEIAANNDPGRYLREHPGLFVTGGIDKRELRFGYCEARAEVASRFRTARQYPTYVPMVDHGVPPDVPLRTFLYMAELITGLADGAGLDEFEPARRLERELGPIERMFDPLEAIEAARAGEDE